MVGERAADAARVIEDFIVHRTLSRPLVVAKFAASLDGRIAAVSGDARWVSGADARAWVHAQRGVLDAIMVGSGTVLADDPLLTARLDAGRQTADGSNAPGTAGSLVRQPLRVVVDSRGRISPEGRVLNRDARTLVATTDASAAAWRAAVAATGGEVLVLPGGDDGRVDLLALLHALGRRNVMSVLVEGGATLLGALFDAKLVDKVQAVIAPLIIGGSALPAVAGRGALHMAGAHRLLDVTAETLGDDVLITGYLRRPIDLLPEWPGRAAE
jgi:diaminohydroxyphosphoribosylaminopyrimidine deaminase/5-amino-6-(5-phosphoribosylamino)uracil reductase